MFATNCFTLSPMTKGNFIKDIRESLGLTTAQLGELVGTSQQQISLLENSDRHLRWDWIERLSKALQCHPLDIIDGPLKPREPTERELVQKFRTLQETEKRIFTQMLDSIAKNDNKPIKKEGK